MNEDDVILTDPDFTETPVITPDTVRPDRVADLTPAEEREIAMRHVAARPNEFVPASVLEEIRRQAPESQPSNQRPMDPPDYFDPKYPDGDVGIAAYQRDLAAYRAQQSQGGGVPTVEAITQAVMQAITPTLAPLIAQSGASSYANLDQSVQPYVQQVLAENPAWAMSKDPAVRAAVEDMAYGRAARAGHLGGVPAQAGLRGTIPNSRAGVASSVRVTTEENNALQRYEDERVRQGLPALSFAEKADLARSIREQG